MIFDRSDLCKCYLIVLLAHYLDKV